MPTPLKTTSNPNPQHFDWRAKDALQRDQEQSNLLHEPKFRIWTTDPITGNDVINYEDHCSLMDGNLCIYFESEDTCNEYQNIEFNHPCLHLPFPETYNDDRGG